MPSDVFRTPNLKNHDEIIVIKAPPSFEGELKKLRDVKVTRTLPAKARKR